LPVGNNPVGPEFGASYGATARDATEVTPSRRPVLATDTASR